MTEQREDHAARYAELDQWGRDRHLNELETLMWRSERHPEQSWTGIMLVCLDSEPDWERFQGAMAWAVEFVPRLQERVVEPLLPLGPPMWERDAHFDMSYHLARVALPGPGTHRQLLDFAQKVALDPLDKSRPPWCGWLVTGLEGGRAAFILKAQHVLFDGAGATRLFSLILNPSVDHIPEKPRGARTPYEPAGLVPGTGQQLVDAGFSVTRSLRFAAEVGRSIVTSPRASLRYAASLARVLQPPRPAQSELLGQGRQRAWNFGTMECPFVDFKAAAKAAGGTVNDAFVAATLGGLRLYFEAVGEGAIGDIPTSMAVSMRTEKQGGTGGNRFAPASIAGPTTGDVKTRVAQLHDRIESVRREPALDILGIVTPALNRLPTTILTAAMGALNSNASLGTSSWPGVSHDVYMAGAKFDRWYGFGPLPGVSMCATLCTQNGLCCIAINADGQVYADGELLWRCMQDGLDELLALRG